MECDVDKVQRDDGKTLAVIKDFKFVAKPLTQIFYNFKNLFNGREDLGKYFIIHFIHYTQLSISTL